MSADEESSGVPTRAIHESYLDMQRALKQYRKAKDAGHSGAADKAYGDLQEGVLTLYELLRPHIKGNNAVDGYWNGEPPRYPGNGDVPDIEKGKAILHAQRHTDTLDSEQLAQLTPESYGNLSDWHEALDLNDDVRLIGVTGVGDKAFITTEAYQMGLRNLDNWETKFQTKTVRMDGFLSGKQMEKQTRTRVDMPRLKRAARELSDVANKLGALSTFDASTPRTEISEELIEEVNEWRQQNIE